MIEATTRMLAPLLATALILVAVSACSVGGDGDADKAGGSEAPEVLRLAVADDAQQPDAPFARYFARRVSALSDGSVRVRVVWDAAGQSDPGYELNIARLVHDGDFELGWMGSRLGPHGHHALPGPPRALPRHRLRARPDRHGPAGEADARWTGRPRLRRSRARARAPPPPSACGRPLASVDDFAGARVRVRPSEATDALMRALGAKPVHISGDDVAAAVADGQIDGAEASLGTNSRDEGENHLTVNLRYSPRR